MQYAIFVVNHRISSSHFQAWRRPPFRSRLARWARLWLGSATGALGGANLEAVLEAPGDGGQRSHAAGTGGLSALGLLGPVVCFSLRVSVLCLCLWKCLSLCLVVVLPSVLSHTDWGLERSVSGGWGGFGLVRSRTLPGLSSGVSARSASVLLDVHGAAAYLSTKISLLALVCLLCGPRLNV